MTRETLGERLAQLRREKAARERRDIDQSDVAAAIGLPGKQSYVSRWENDVIPKDDVLGKLAAFYGVNVGWLRYGDGEQYAPIPLETESERDITSQPTAARRAAGGRRRT